jgi:hypothetical protein
VVEEVTGKAEVRQISSSLLPAAASFRRPALTVMVLGAAAVIVVLLLRVNGHRIGRGPVMAMAMTAALTASGLHSSAALAHPLRRRLSRGSLGR